MTNKNYEVPRRMLVLGNPDCLARASIDTEVGLLGLDPEMLA